MKLLIKKGPGNAIQPKDTPAKAVEKVADKVGSVEGNVPKKATGLTIPGRAPLTGTGSSSNNSAGKAPLQTNTLPPQQASQPTTGVEYPGQDKNIPAKVYDEFLENKKILADTLTQNRDMIGYALRRIMIDLKSHAELAEFMHPEDMGNMIRALRMSYGNAVAIKEKGKRKKKDTNTPAGFNMDDLKGMLDVEI